MLVKLTFINKNKCSDSWNKIYICSPVAKRTLPEGWKLLLILFKIRFQLLEHINKELLSILQPMGTLVGGEVTKSSF